MANVAVDDWICNTEVNNLYIVNPVFICNEEGYEQMSLFKHSLSLGLSTF